MTAVATSRDAIMNGLRMAAPHAQGPDSSLQLNAVGRRAGADLDAAHKLLQHSQEVRLKPNAGAADEVARFSQNDDNERAEKEENNSRQAEVEARRPEDSSTRASSQDLSSDAQGGLLSKPPVTGQVCRYVIRPFVHIISYHILPAS